MFLRSHSLKGAENARARQTALRAKNAAFRLRRRRHRHRQYRRRLRRRRPRGALFAVYDVRAQ